MLNSKQIQTFQKNGYLVVRGLFANQEIAPILDACRDTKILDQYTSTNKDFNGKDSFRAAFWRDPNGATLLAKLPIMERLVTGTEQLLDTECYYWRSRLVFKKPNEPGRVEYHQDYSFWYRDGCAFPDMLSCSVAITACNKRNGCLEVLRGSHHVGRLDLDDHLEGAEYPDPSYVEKIATRCEKVFCEMEPGDCIFFHGNTLHGSGPNKTNGPRILVHNTYNAHYNAPLVPKGQSELLASSQQYEKIEKIDDDFISNGNYDGVFDNDVFFPQETDAVNDVGIFKRHNKRKSRRNATG